MAGPANVLFRRSRTIGRGVLNEWGSLGIQRGGYESFGDPLHDDIYLVCRGIFWTSRSLTRYNIQNEITQGLF